MTIHPRESEILGFLAGESNQDESSTIAAHLDACPTCRELADRLTELPRDLWATLVAAADRSSRADRPPAPEFPGYRVEKELGRGGCGVVYRALENLTGRTVAIKVLRAGSLASPSEHDWFLREARSSASLRHPNIVSVLAVGETAGLPYYVMEYMAAGSLHDRLDGTPLAPHEAARLVESIARAAHHAHRSGIIHRDLKPGNILLEISTEPGAIHLAKLSDFGMAKQLDATEATPTQAILGTPSYMSPEQAFGKSREVGPASDVYSLGAILHELLTGRPPFKGATQYETLLLVRENDPVSPRRLRRGIPRDLDTICLKCLEKEPERRYADAESLADDLSAFLKGRPVLARPIGPIGRLVRVARRNPIESGISLIAMLALVATLAALTVALERSEKQTAMLADANDKARDRDAKLLKALAFSADSTSKLFSNPTLVSKLDQEILLRQLRIFEEIPELPDNPQEEHDMAYAMLQLASGLWNLGEREASHRAARNASATLERLVRKHPANNVYAYHAAQSYVQLSSAVEGEGNLEEVIRLNRKAVEIGEQLVRNAPKVDAYRGDLANFQARLALAYMRSGRNSEAEPLLELSIAEQCRMIRLYAYDPMRYEYYKGVLTSYTHLLRFAPNGTERICELAKQHLKIVEIARKQRDWHLIAPRVLHPCLATILHAAGRKREAAEQLEQGRREWRELASRVPSPPLTRVSYASWLADLGCLLWEEDPERASASFREALSLLRDEDRGSVNPESSSGLLSLLLFCPDPSVANPREALQAARALPESSPIRATMLGQALVMVGEYEEARPYLERALKANRGVGDDGPTQITRLLLAKVLAGLGRHGEAAAVRAEAAIHRQAMYIAHITDQETIRRLASP